MVWQARRTARRPSRHLAERSILRGSSSTSAAARQGRRVAGAGRLALGSADAVRVGRAHGIAIASGEQLRKWSAPTANVFRLSRIVRRSNTAVSGATHIEHPPAPRRRTTFLKADSAGVRETMDGMSRRDARRCGSCERRTLSWYRSGGPKSRRPLVRRCIRAI